MARLARNLLLTALALCLAATAQAQAPDPSWTLLPDSPVGPLSARHDDVFFVDPALGWVVNLRGQIFHTTDGGQTWTMQLDTASDPEGRVLFRSVGFATANVGWAGTLSETRPLFETRDGGQTWTDATDRIAGPRPAGICGLWVVNEQVAYGVGRFDGPPRLIKTTDGGQTWTAKDLSAYAGTLVDVIFFDEHHGLVVGGTGSDLRNASAVVLATADGGDTWQVRHTSQGVGEWGWKISFPTATTGYVSVERFELGAKVLKTTDGGLTWTGIFIEGGRPLQGIGFVTEDVGWISGRGTTWRTGDGGATWQQVALDGFINRFRLLGDTLGYAAGKQVYKFVRSAPTAVVAEISLPRAALLEPNYPNPFTVSTTLRYALNVETRVRLTLYDVLGRRVATLVARRQAPGSHEATWDGADDAGTPVPPGVYLYRLEAGGSVQAGTMLLLGH